MILGIDNGNYNTKSSEGVLYASGYTSSGTAPISHENVLEYQGRYYCVGDRRLPVQADKTLTEDTFILTLPAIAQAVELTGDSVIQLGVGLPIVSYGNQRERFAAYFQRSAVFRWAGQEYNITIQGCKAFPQGYAAMISQFHTLRDYHTIYIIDIGGYTVDILAVINGKPDKGMSVSLQLGVINLYSDIKSELLADEIKLTERQLSIAIKGLEHLDHLDAEKIEAIVEAKRATYLRTLLNTIREVGIDLRNPVALAGGGAELLARHLKNERINLVAVLDRFANSKGYKILMGG